VTVGWAFASAWRNADVSSFLASGLLTPSWRASLSDIGRFMVEEVFFRERREVIAEWE
jgi:hypothetical protein